MKFIKILYCGNDIQMVNQQQVITLLVTYNLRPRLPPFLLVESEGIGVTSSIRPIFMAERANARRADCAPGPGVFVLFPPVARSLMCRAVIPRDLHFSATSCIRKKIKFGKTCFIQVRKEHRLSTSENNVLMKHKRNDENYSVRLPSSCKIC